MSDYVGNTFQDILLKELIKNCKKLRSQGNGCFDCGYSSDSLFYDYRIGYRMPSFCDIYGAEMEVEE